MTRRLGEPAPSATLEQRAASALSAPVSVPAKAWAAYGRLTELGFPHSFPIVQFPNAPLIVGLASGAAATISSGAGNTALMSVSYLSLALWAYGELSGGANWFRRLLGLAYVLLLIVRVAQALG
jgi:hypothetical protein